MNSIVKKYNALAHENQNGGLERFFQRVRFVNGEMLDLGQWRQKISAHICSMLLFFNLVSVCSLGRIEQQMTGELKSIRLAVNEITANFLAVDRVGSEGSVFTTYRNE